MQNSRLFQIVYLLLSNQSMTAKALAARLEVSTRTVYRDVEALCAAGIPISTLPGQGGGISLMQGFTLDRALLTGDEQQLVIQALEGLTSTENPQVQQALSKLTGIFTGRQPAWLAVDLSDWHDQGKKTFEAIRDAILARRRIRFDYYAATGEKSCRLVEPWRLWHKHRVWYLQALDVDKAEARLFRLSRVQNLVPQTETFAMPDTLPELEASYLSRVPMVMLTMAIDQSMAHRVYDDFAPDQIERLPDGSFLVQAPYVLDNWVMGYLLSFGPGLQLLAPHFLRQQLHECAKKMLANHDMLTDCCPQRAGILSSKANEEDTTMNHETFCQSCAMPLTQAELGTNQDGSASADYCKYCYQNGAFTKEETMAEMIETCVPFMVQANPGMHDEQARAQMTAFFPQLKRWQRA